MMCEHDNNEPEEATFGCVNGKVLLIRSDDIEPSHFHFGDYIIKLRKNAPKSIDELRDQIIEAHSTITVSDDELIYLLNVLGKKFAHLDLTTYDAMRMTWVVFHSPDADKEYLFD